MLIEELMKDEYNAGKAEGKKEGKQEGMVTALSNSVLNFVSDLEPVSDNLKSRIASIEDIDTLTMLNKKAARVKSIEEFERELTAQNY